ncbi:two-component system, chemotaxis family, response regulator CheY [Loktanella atrilutea]|uniref:Two-component system, chemotaxis family, response regulator CheY n=1 Tax=Loktanella atrilutea TaxID=366533 RepID=A0A1M4WZV3_LOKAT|nr:response regulator [Loktanella atrilutea]SHE86778.1 two-component system, chemotaxis family, response regulator CheY [Loktanella atrilutea]
MSLKDTISIMVVDDMSTSRGLITMALDEIGVKNVDFRSDGQSALASIAAKPVHLVISDYNMPGLDGLQLLHGLRTNRNTQRIGFILVSGRLDETIVATGRKLGMNNFIAKPFNTQQMRKCIEAVVGPL